MLSFFLFYQDSLGQTQQLDITNRVLYDDIPINAKKSAKIQANDVEGYLRILDPDYVVEPILHGFGCAEIEVKKSTNTIGTLYTTGKYTRRGNVLEVEFTSERRTSPPASSPYAVADINILLGLAYSTAPQASPIPTSKQALNVYSGVRIPSDIEPREISVAVWSTYVYVCYRNVIVKYNTTTHPWTIEAVVDLNQVIPDKTTISSISTACQERYVAGKIISVTSSTVEVIVNVAKIRDSSGNPTYNAFRVFSFSTENLSLTSAGNYLVEQEDVQNVPYPSYSVVIKLGDGRYVFFLKGTKDALVVVTNGTSYLTSLVTITSNILSEVTPAGYSQYNASGWYDVLIASPVMLYLRVYSSSITTAGSLINLLTNEYYTHAVGYWNSGESRFYVSLHRKTQSGEYVYFGYMTFSSTPFTSLRVWSVGKVSGFGYGYRSGEMVQTTSGSSTRYTYSSATGQLSFPVLGALTQAFTIRYDTFWIYLNPVAGVGGICEYRTGQNIYMTSYTSDIVEKLQLGIIYNGQFYSWNNVADSGITISRSSYLHQPEETRDVPVHLRHIIKTVDNERIVQELSWWAFADVEVAWPITSELARALLGIAYEYKKWKRYRIQSFEDYVQYVGQKVSFEDPSGRIQTAVLLSASFTLSSVPKYEYELIVLQPEF